jgi:hypothetical protein
MTGRRPLRGPGAVAMALALWLAGCAGAPLRPAGPDPGAPSTDSPPALAVPGSPANGAGPATPEAGGDTEAPTTPDVSGVPGTEPDGGEGPERLAWRERLLERGRSLLGLRVPADCTGYVLRVYREAGVPVPFGRNAPVEALYAASREVARPRPGDLAFFHDTFDRNRNGRLDDPFTHVALVEAVDGDEVTLLHRGGRIERIRMDLAHPSDPARNDPLRVHRRHDARATRYLAGELFTAFGELLPGVFTQMLQSSPCPEAEGCQASDHEREGASTRGGGGR